ncbi:MAG: DUF1501 domain-containing protein [Aquabacterium sp.]|uniref:DUF1501 domain-containing protein n=1 Tax=Aquabacterium sp. TaxID=1872578 RepID=UPI0025C6F9E5|nr:DUF1501 domain-containing protein [Aquabacterium sp.]MBI5924284.1 DUF1501 domain-containing protein [Aquabacterium sp.]
MSAIHSSRRAFLRRAGALSMLGSAAPWAFNLAAMADAAAASSSSNDYKALVCVFLQGGNDQANTLIPFDTPSYLRYSAARPTLAVTQASLQATALTPAQALPDARQMALAPALAPIKPYFDMGKLAVLLNIGPLVQPTTLDDFRARRLPLPPKLFSHNDQQSVWQSHAHEGAQSGWGGRMGDLFMSGNGKAAFTCVNMAGNAVFLSGDQSTPYTLDLAGPAPLRAADGLMYGSAACSELFRRVVTQPGSTHVMAQMHARTMSRAVEAQAELSAALAGVQPMSTSFTAGNRLAAQLKMVARMVAARGQLGLSRQVFFVMLGGFDLHDNLGSQHPVLLGQVADALKSFADATNELGVADRVTTFTASDFGRTLSSNGDGSDHGWGSHHLVLGGAVQGGRFYGALPDAGLNGAQDIGQGRLLPTMAVDQLAGALANWMGVSGVDQRALIAPHLSSFDPQVLASLLLPTAPQAL